jgi:polyhydroxyalkanoate synthesis regulator phasin
MTSISATSTTGYSPLDLLKQELAKEVSSGTVSSTDETALSSALDDIDSALKSQIGSSSTGTPPSPDQMQSKINSLIDNEVSSGKRTADQAKELKAVFANTFADSPGGAASAASASSDASSSDTTSSTDSSSSSTTTDIEELLKTLLEALHNSDKQTTSSYSANGTNASSTTSTSLVLDYSA